MPEILPRPVVFPARSPGKKKKKQKPSTAMQPTERPLRSKMERTIEKYLASGLTGKPFFDAVAQALSMSPKVVRKIYEQLAPQLARDWLMMFPHAAATQVMRLGMDQWRMRNPPPQWAAKYDAAGRKVTLRGKVVYQQVPGKIDWDSVIASERLRAQIEGTLRPTEVITQDAGPRDRIIEIIQGLSPEEIDALDQEQRELEERAGTNLTPKR